MQKVRILNVHRSISVCSCMYACVWVGIMHAKITMELFCHPIPANLKRQAPQKAGSDTLAQKPQNSKLRHLPRPCVQTNQFSWLLIHFLNLRISKKEAQWLMEVYCYLVDEKRKQETEKTEQNKGAELWDTCVDISHQMGAYTNESHYSWTHWRIVCICFLAWSISCSFPIVMAWKLEMATIRRSNWLHKGIGNDLALL